MRARAVRQEWFVDVFFMCDILVACRTGVLIDDIDAASVQVDCFAPGATVRQCLGV